MQVAMRCGGYTPGEADQLRRAMSNKRSYEQMHMALGDLKTRMLARGFSADLSDTIQEMIFGFADYGFPRAHAYPFAHLALISATLKLRHPAVFYTALLNSQPMGFYAPAQIVRDAGDQVAERRHFLGLHQLRLAVLERSGALADPLLEFIDLLVAGVGGHRQ